MTENKRIIISDDEFIKLYNEGYTQAEIARLTGISAAQASRRCKKLNLNSTKNNKANYKKIDKEKFLELYNRKIPDSQIAKEMGFSESKINSFRKSLDLPVVDRKHFIDEDFIIEYDKGYTDKELAEIFNVSSSYITQRRNKLGLNYNEKEKEIIPLTEEEFQVILGTTLGDTTLERRKKNTNGTCKHCIAQKEFIFKKYEYLKNISREPRLINCYDERFKEPNYQTWYWYINANPSLNELHEKFYKSGKKKIDKELIMKIEPLGIAIWYMDDGAKHGNSCSFCTHGFDLESVKILQDMFLEKFNIKTSIHTSHALYILSESIQNFKNLIKPYLVESMLYKIM